MSTRCKHYVDMGEHNKPLCDKRGYRPAECELCPTRVASLESDNAKLRELAHDMWRLLLATGNDDLVLSVEVNGVVKEVIDAEELAKAMRELGIEVE